MFHAPVAQGCKQAALCSCCAALPRCLKCLAVIPPQLREATGSLQSSALPPPLRPILALCTLSLPLNASFLSSPASCSATSYTSSTPLTRTGTPAEPSCRSGLQQGTRHIPIRHEISTKQPALMPAHPRGTGPTLAAAARATLTAAATAPRARPPTAPHRVLDGCTTLPWPWPRAATCHMAQAPRQTCHLPGCSLLRPPAGCMQPLTCSPPTTTTTSSTTHRCCSRVLSCQHRHPRTGQAAWA